VSFHAAIPAVYRDDMDVLYLAASGPSDPTRASIPWHLAANGSVEAGQSTGIVLLGDAAGVVAPALRDELAGVGLPPLRELIAKARASSLPVFV
jgi:predicted peroxiredoxin